MEDGEGHIFKSQRNRCKKIELDYAKERMILFLGDTIKFLSATIEVEDG